MEMGKFRAWDTEKELLCEVDTMNWNMNTAMLKRDDVDAYGIEGKHVVFMEYTGVISDLGQEFCESDICTADYICPVSFDNAPHRLTGTIERDDSGLWMFDYGHGSMPLNTEGLQNVTIIGTVYTAPEFLE